MSAVEGVLSSLFEEDYFLEKIFSNLLEDGLHECRLVCKRWYNASKTQPVKLVPTLTDTESCSRMEQFPNVRSVVLGINVKRSDSQVERENPHFKHAERFRLTSDIVQFLASFQNLKHLDMSDVETSVPDFYVEQCYRCLSRLHSLNIGGNYFGTDYAAAMASLSHLTDLTALTLLDPSRGSQRGLVPLTGLSKIQRLVINAKLLPFADEQQLFPCLTNLTHLTLNRHSCEPDPPLSHVLRAIDCHALSLQTLTFDVLFCAGVDHLEIYNLAQFKQLKSLKLYVEKRNLLDLSLLGDMPNLEDLTVNTLHLTESLAQWLASLPELKSLSYAKLVRNDREVGEDAVGEDYISSLRRLTKLEFVGPEIGQSIELLDLLTDLKIHVNYLRAFYVFDFTLMLETLPNLERLELCCLEIFVPSFTLSTLTKLKSLTLIDVCLDEDIFFTLQPFQQLTALNLGLLNADTAGCEVNLMTQLLSLTLTSVFDPLDQRYLQSLKSGWFPRLQHLKLGVSRFSEEDETALRRCMPCLRRLTSIAPLRKPSCV